MQCLFTINPQILDGNNILIYGTGVYQKRIFFALLQQNVPVRAFIKKKKEVAPAEKLFGKYVLSLDEIAELGENIHVIVTGITSEKDVMELEKYGVKNIVLENITAEKLGILL